jgi:hypothetical protein
MRRPSSSTNITALAADQFESPLGRLRFIRDAAGRVTQISVEQARVYDLRFDRVDGR